MQNCDKCHGKRWYAVLGKNGLQKKDKSGKLLWRCYRCNNQQTEPDEQPIIDVRGRVGASILYIDLEVSKSMYYSYGAKVPSRYLNPKDRIHSYYIICWVASYMHEDKIYGQCVTPEMAQGWNEAEILQPLRDLMSSADAIAGHNVDGYDIKRANTRYLLNGIEPVIGKPTYDTLKIARSKFAFESNRLGDISETLGLNGKDAVNDDDWRRIVSTGDEKTLKKVFKYCKGDVREGKRLLDKFMMYTGKKDNYGSIAFPKEPKEPKEPKDKRFE